MMVNPKASQNIKIDGSHHLPPSNIPWKKKMKIGFEPDFMLLALIEPLAVSIHPIASVFVRLG